MLEPIQINPGDIVVVVVVVVVVVYGFQVEFSPAFDNINICFELCTFHNKDTLLFIIGQP